MILILGGLTAIPIVTKIEGHYALLRLFLEHNLKVIIIKIKTKEKIYCS